MKAKMSLDKKAIQGFFIRHVEKMVLVVIVSAFLGLAYGAATRSGYPRKPEELQAAAQQADDNIEQIKQQVAPDWAKVTPYPEIAKQSRNAVSETSYVWRNPFDKPIWPELPRRTTPPLFAAESIKGSAGVGGFLLKAGGSGQQQVGQRWIVVTGLVPAAKQVEAYAETFKDLKRPESDTPRYIHYWVERAEMFGDARDANPNWVQINVLAAKQVQNSWASTPQEVVAATHIHEPLVFPLGPLMTASWGEEVAHPPEIPLATATTGSAPTAAAGKPQGPVSDVPQDMPPTGAAKPAADLPAAPAAPATPAAPAGGATIGVPAPGVAAPGGMAAGPAATPGTEGAEDEAHGADLSAVKYLLVRFFDFTVEPGNRYAYRVKLLLANPNQKVEARFLTDPKLAELSYIDTEWSDASAPVFVPRDDRLLAGSVKLVRGEPVALVTLVKWMSDRGIESSHEFELPRGKLANLSSEVTGVAEVEDSGDSGGLVDETPSPAKSRKKEAGPTITYRTDALLIDVRGGEKGRDKTVEPAELLLLDYDGRLLVRGELDDQLLIPKPPKVEAEGEVTLEGKSTGKDKKDKKGSGESDLFGTSFGDGDKKSKKDKPIGKKK